LFIWLLMYLCFCFHKCKTRGIKGSSWSGSYGSWIYNYLCNQCQSPLTLLVRIPVMARSTRYTTMWKKFVSGLRQVRWFLRALRFPHQYKWPPGYNCNIVESCVKHHSTNSYSSYIGYIPIVFQNDFVQYEVQRQH
jgi:hypothetical protein